MIPQCEVVGGSAVRLEYKPEWDANLKKVHQIESHPTTSTGVRMQML